LIVFFSTFIYSPHKKHRAKNKAIKEQKQHYQSPCQVTTSHFRLHKRCCRSFLRSLFRPSVHIVSIRIAWRTRRMQCYTYGRLIRWRMNILIGRRHWTLVQCVWMESHIGFSLLIVVSASRNMFWLETTRMLRSTMGLIVMEFNK